MSPNRLAIDHAKDAVVRKAIEQRLAARRAKNFAESDRIRDELLAMGIQLKDGKDPHGRAGDDLGGEAVIATPSCSDPSLREGPPSPQGGGMLAPIPPPCGEGPEQSGGGGGRAAIGKARSLRQSMTRYEVKLWLRLRALKDRASASGGKCPSTVGSLISPASPTASSLKWTGCSMGSRASRSATSSVTPRSRASALPSCVSRTVRSGRISTAWSLRSSSGALA